MIQIFKPSVVLTDIELGRASGFELLKKIRDLGKEDLVHLPVIAMSAHSEEKMRQKIKAAGFTLEFQKPVDAEVLIDAVARLTVVAGGNRTEVRPEKEG